MTLKKAPQLKYSNETQTVSIRNMDTGVWNYVGSIAKLNNMTTAELICKLLELLDEKHSSNE